MQQDSAGKFPGIEIGSLWFSKTPGNMSGSMGGKYGARIVLVQNKNKQGQQPDAKLFVMPYEKKEGEQDKRDNMPF
tara:strand:- start:14 stop:241 length:228 start_codon:yes stop_codon:yes gene_type:complete